MKIQYKIATAFVMIIAGGFVAVLAFTTNTFNIRTSEKVLVISGIIAFTGIVWLIRMIIRLLKENWSVLFYYSGNKKARIKTDAG